MKTNLECIPCFLKQSLQAARMATDDEALHEHVLKEVMLHLNSVSFEDSPPEISREIHNIIRNLTQSDDPYKKVKDASNNLIKNKYHQLTEMMKQAKDPLEMAIKLAIIGNIIDYGALTTFSLEDMLQNKLQTELNQDAYQRFKQRLDQADTILYLADNTGEIFFDKLLLEKLKEKGKQITYVVRANPIINDATFEDVEFAEIDTLVSVIKADEGQALSAPGLVLSYASPQFIDAFESADMIISKGQGNYEGLSNVNREVFFLLVVKCPLVAQDIQEEIGKLILKVKA